LTLEALEECGSHSLLSKECFLEAYKRMLRISMIFQLI